MYIIDQFKNYNITFEKFTIRNNNLTTAELITTSELWQNTLGGNNEYCYYFLYDAQRTSISTI